MRRRDERKYAVIGLVITGVFFLLAFSICSTGPTPPTNSRASAPTRATADRCVNGRRPSTSDWQAGDTVYLGNEIYGYVAAVNPNWTAPNRVRGKGLTIRFDDGSRNTFLETGMSGYDASCRE